MHRFKSPEEDPAPELSFSLDDIDRVYEPGDVITGTVQGWDISSNRIIQVAFQGQCKSYILHFIHNKGPGPGYNVHSNSYGYSQGSVAALGQSARSKEVAYNSEINLFRDVHRLKPADYIDAEEVPFAFTVPKTANKLDKAWPGLLGFEKTGGHLLPPSANMPRQGYAFSTDAMTAWGGVEYKVLVSLLEPIPNTNRLKVLKVLEKNIRFTPTPMSLSEFEVFKQEKGTQHFERELEIHTKELDLHHRASREDHSWKDKFRHAFSQTPTLKLAAGITIPKVVVIGQKIQITLDLKVALPKGEPEYEFPLPPVIMERVWLTIKRNLGARTLTPGGELYQAHIEETPATIVRDYKADKVFLPTRDEGRQYERTQWHCRIEIPAHVVPTFHTVNLYQKWIVTGTAHFKCLGKHQTADLKSQVDFVGQPRPGYGEEEMVDAMKMDLES